jgi:hypothetical protein
VLRGRPGRREAGAASGVRIGALTPVARRLHFAVALAAAAFVPLMGCSSSVLVRGDDQTFLRAEARLEKTVARVEALAPPPGERALFMQAEGFYRYRFTPSRGAFTYAAEITAILIELPALQSLAGSLDLLDLRLRANDASVQLWETLLALHPTTVLRPLTLYRLGWAYRNSAATGMPRESGDEAFDALAAEAKGTPLARLALEAKAVPWKSKDTAAAWSVVPGLGQFYVGEKLSGSIRLVVALAAAAAIVIPIYVGYQRRDDLTWSHDWPLLAAGLGGLFVLSADYTTAYEDAMRGVVLFNERTEAAFEDAHPDAP